MAPSHKPKTGTDPISSSRALRRRSGLVASEQLLALLARRAERAGLDVAEAADRVRNRGDLEREGVVLRRQASEQPLDGFLVLADQRALDTALFRIPEGIERGASEHLQVLKDFENPQHP